jgi:uncharacterized membrane protein (UPF0127 family)
VRRALRLVVFVLVACSAPEPRAEGAGAREVAFVKLGGEAFTLELALDPATRQRGLSGRSEIPRNGGMLFVLPRPQPFAMVMRDCPVPIDVAFLDAEGRVLAVHEMPVEPPRAPGESPFAYEARLPLHPSPAPALFAIETAGGRLREVGLVVGARVGLDAKALVARAR